MVCVRSLGFALDSTRWSRCTAQGVVIDWKSVPQGVSLGARVWLSTCSPARPESVLLCSCRRAITTNFEVTRDSPACSQKQTAGSS